MNELTAQFNYMYLYKMNVGLYRSYVYIGIHAKGYKYHCMWSYDNE